MAARVDPGCTADSNTFPVRYQKAKNERGYRSTRTASLDTSRIAFGELWEQAVLVHSKTCSEIARKGECYGRGVVDKGVSKDGEQVNVGDEANSLQGISKIEAEEVDGHSLFDVAKLNEQLQYLKSCIHLSLEEAFYLVHCKQALKVWVDRAEIVLTAEELWKHCCEKVKDFHHRFVVYHYYRSKGWVPKPGAKFGVHFLLYKGGPAYYHSSYGVVVRSVMPASELTWQFVILFVRTMESVNKGAIICEVKANQTEVTSVDLSTPSCISHFIVEETMIHRWLPKQNRD